MKRGAYDYITKPFSVDEIRLVVEKALEKKKLSSENRALRQELEERASPQAAVGRSGRMQEAIDLIARMPDHGEVMSRIIQSYDAPIVRAYCWGRFKILRQRFLVEIGQYLPDEGLVLDVGSGIGMFAMYFAHGRPDLSIRGFDLNEKRVELSRRAAGRLGLENVQFEVGRAEHFRAGGSGVCQGIYILDVIHHMPKAAVRPLLEAFHETLVPGGRLIVKEVDTRPAYKRLFTHFLDLLMDSQNPPHYWPSEGIRGLLAEVGFRVYQHAMIDYLPYPHMLYVCEKSRA
jgi:2-polyprenyl-3-methyl-5-hydroxy-6-metoxy-1,4-benzoquinol methylase